MEDLVVDLMGHRYFPSGLQPLKYPRDEAALRPPDSSEHPNQRIAQIYNMTTEAVLAIY